MGTRTEYAPGVFCWVDLATPDPEAAKRFYDALFGWEFEEAGGDDEPYSMAKSDGHVAAGIAGVPEGPPRWQSYIAVESADDTAGKAEEAGAEVVMAPTTIGPPGRMAMLTDPAGAPFAIWEAGERAGAEIVNVPGTFCWNDLMTHDVEKAVAFYGEVFGWELGEVEDAPNQRHGIRVGETMNGGLAAIPDAVGDAMPSHWLVCFAVDDVEASRRAVSEHGGEAVTEILVVPSGRFAVVQDPQGAMFGIVDGDLDP